MKKQVAVILNQKSWKEYGLDDLRHIPKALRLPEPDMIQATSTEKEAVAVLEFALGFQQTDSKITIESPIEQIIIQKDKLPHTVEKRLDARERYANFIKTTIFNPLEIWAVQYENGIRHRYIAAYSGDNDIVIMITIEPDGNLFWNFMQRESRKMNKQREGELIYSKI